MYYNFDNFIMTMDDFFTPEECSAMIQSYYRCEAMGLTISRQRQDNTPSHLKKDDQLYVSDLASVSEFDMHMLTPFSVFQNKFWDMAWPVYAEQYSAIHNYPKMTSRIMKFQKTEVGGGYHVWHFENDTQDNLRRILTYIVYLNDVDEGGESEFLYYPKRVKPKTGRMIVWPAGFAHTHRGNPPISNTKYIITGWIEVS
jgi:hypothetical protein